MITQEQRDELLIRTDERVCILMAEDIPEIKEHLQKLNGRVRGNEVRSKVNQAMISGIIAIGGFFAGIAKWVGWW